jgi:hypothetical protein
MKLVEGWAGNLPMRFLVEIAQSHGIGQKQIELLGHFQADGFFQFQGQRVVHGAVLLDFMSSLVKVRLGGYSSIVARKGFLRH